MNLDIAKAFLVLSGMSLLTACASYTPTEADFGNSVRQMVRSQTVVTGPVDTEPAETGDGERLDHVLELYRGDVQRGNEGAPPVTVQFGSGAPAAQ